jgi:hypothetical protein
MVLPLVLTLVFQPFVSISIAGISKASRGSMLRCDEIRGQMDKGLETRTIVRSYIEVGHNSCVVIKCSVSSGADIAQVMQGAVDAGTQNNIITGCALQGGASPETVAEILAKTTFSPSVCYFPPDAYPYTLPVEMTGYQPPFALPYAPTPVDEVVLDIPARPVSPSMY